MQLRRSMEGLQLVSLDRRLILVQMRERVLGTIMVRLGRTSSPGEEGKLLQGMLTLPHFFPIRKIQMN